MKKKILSLLLSAAMLLSLLPMTVLAAEGSALPSTGGTLSGGNYYLAGNVTLTNNITISGNVTLDLNGHVLKGTGTGSVITVTNTGNLTLTDSSDPSTGKITGGKGNGVSTDKGTIYYGGGVYVYGTFTMNGGTISENSANCGGGVYVYGTFNMNDGSITGNTANMGAGGVYVNGGTFTMTGGSITGNTGTCFGGGVNIVDNSFSKIGGSFIMTGGNITGNTAVMGGGVNITDGSFTMTGGNIADNTATYFGGGVYVTGNAIFNLGGTAKITDNIKDTGEGKTVNNLELSYDKTITLATGDNAPKDGMSVGVTLANGTGVFTVENSADYHALFTPDAGKDYKVINLAKDSNKLKLIKKYIVTKAAKPEGVEKMTEGVQALINDEGVKADMRFFWNIDFNGNGKPDNLGAYLFNFAPSIQDYTSKVEKQTDDSVTDGSIFYATITEIQSDDFEQKFYAIPIVNLFRRRLYH